MKKIKLLPLSLCLLLCLGLMLTGCGQRGTGSASAGQTADEEETQKTKTPKLGEDENARISDTITPQDVIGSDSGAEQQSNETKRQDSAKTSDSAETSPQSPAGTKTPSEAPSGVSETIDPSGDIGDINIAGFGESADTEVTPSTDESNEPVWEGRGYTVAIDAGHQAVGNPAHEPIGPGASETKPKVASGTSGVSTGVPEYILTLEVSIKLKAELESRGYEVFMIRDTHDVDISNAKRAEMANESGADIFVRIHANGVNDSSVAGGLCMAPTASNPYVGYMADECEALSRNIIDAYCKATGFRNMGIQYYDNMSGINWCKIPVSIVELGFMTNPAEDERMQDNTVQRNMAVGIADGIDAYFGV